MGRPVSCNVMLSDCPTGSGGGHGMGRSRKEEGQTVSCSPRLEESWDGISGNPPPWGQERDCPPHLFYQANYLDCSSPPPNILFYFETYQGAAESHRRQEGYQRVLSLALLLSFSQVLRIPILF